jgi:hypothetical protein
MLFLSPDENDEALARRDDVAARREAASASSVSDGEELQPACARSRQILWTGGERPQPAAAMPTRKRRVGKIHQFLG